VPLTGVTEKATPLYTVVVLSAIEGFWLTVTDNERAALVPQLLPAVTVIFPSWPAVPVVTVIAAVPDPPVIVHPAGTVQVYVDAPDTAEILYV
jgi:hypothetical protein